MLLHGFGGNKDHFTLVARFLKSHYHLIIPDLIGSGDSSRPLTLDYSPKAQMQRLRMLAQTLGIQKIHLGGSSMGGQTAITYAAHYPDEVKSVWLLDTAGVWSAPKSQLFEIIESTGRNMLKASNEDEFSHAFDFAMSDPPFIPRPMLDVIARENIRDPIIDEQVFNALTANSVEPYIADLIMPVLIVFGDQDRVISVGTAEVLHKMLPHAKVIILPNVGHLPMLEQPKKWPKITCSLDLMFEKED